MSSTRNSLYITILTATFIGYLWLGISLIKVATIENVEVCLIKKVTNVPCPSCGTTRSVMSIAKGEFINAALLNPLGFILVAIMIVVPIWIIVDLIKREESFYITYKKGEQKFIKPTVYIPFIIVIIANWMWNIIKGI